MTDKKTEHTVVQDIATPQSTTNAEGGKIFWNDKEMRSSYANVVNVATTADEFMFLFGTNEAWNNVQKDIRVNLHERIIMTPTAAKRLQMLLNKTMEEYELKMGVKKP
jgi:hypothetical protein